MVSLKAILIGVASALSVAHALDPDWVALGTEGSQISFDGNTLCVSNNGGGILYSTKEFQGHPTWDYQQGNVYGARVWGDKIWAVGLNGEVMYTSATKPDYTSYTPKDWITVPGKLKSLAVDGKQLCGIDFDNEIVCADDELTTNPHWRKLPGKFTQLDLTDGVITAVAEHSGIIYTGFSHGDTDWKLGDDSFQQVSYDGGILCGITGYRLLCASKGLPSAPEWQHYEGEFTFVEVQAGRVFAVGRDTMIYERYLTKRPEVMGLDWSALQPGPQLRQLNFDGKTVVGTASDMGVWVATDNFDYSPNWFKVDGLLTHVVVWGDRLYGVNTEHMLWTGRPSSDVQWKKLEGEFVQVSTDGKQLCAVSPGNEIWCADTRIDSTPNWRRVDGGYQHVVVLNGVLMASRVGDDSVWVGRSQGAPKWHMLEGVNLRHFEYDGTNLCGTDKDGKILLVNSGFVDGAPNVQVLTGKATYTAINGNRIFAVTQDYSLYSRANL